jgi:membrane protease subunit (stomatin/prohibitin family)
MAHGLIGQRRGVVMGGQAGLLLWTEVQSSLQNNKASKHTANAARAFGATVVVCCTAYMHLCACGVFLSHVLCRCAKISSRTSVQQE